jgi:hypothetical protein
LTFGRQRQRLVRRPERTGDKARRPIRAVRRIGRTARVNASAAARLSLTHQMFVMP